MNNLASATQVGRGTRIQNLKKVLSRTRMFILSHLTFWGFGTVGNRKEGFQLSIYVSVIVPHFRDRLVQKHGDGAIMSGELNPFYSYPLTSCHPTPHLVAHFLPSILLRYIMILWGGGASGKRSYKKMAAKFNNNKINNGFEVLTLNIVFRRKVSVKSVIVCKVMTLLCIICDIMMDNYLWTDRGLFW